MCNLLRGTLAFEIDAVTTCQSIGRFNLRIDSFGDQTDILEKWFLLELDDEL
jgi:hypothetical protein